MYNQYGTSTGLPVLQIVIMPDICQYRTITKYQYGTSTGLPVLKIVIIPDICQYRTSTKCQQRQQVREQHWQTSAEHRYHPRHMPVQAPVLSDSIAPALASTGAVPRPF